MRALLKSAKKSLSEQTENSKEFLPVGVNVPLAGDNGQRGSTMRILRRQSCEERKSGKNAIKTAFQFGQEIFAKGPTFLNSK